MTARIREFLKRRTDEGPCLVVDLDVVRDNYLGFARRYLTPGLLRHQGQSGAGNPEAARRARLLLRRRLARRDQAVLAAGATPDRISYGNTIKKESDIAAVFALGVTAIRGGLRGRGRQGRPRGARLAGDLPHPLRRCGRRMAAVAQVRLRACLRRRHSRTCAPAGPRRLRDLVPCRLATAQCRSLGLRARLDGWRVPELRRARHQPVHGQSRRRLPGQVHPQDAEARNPTARRSSARCGSTSATPSRTPSSSPAAASSAMPA